MRRRRGWRQIDLAVHSELSKTHPCDIETRRREIGLEVLKRIADSLDVGLSKLLDGF